MRQISYIRSLVLLILWLFVGTGAQALPEEHGRIRPCSEALQIGAYRLDMLTRLSKTWSCPELSTPLVVLVSVDQDGNLVKIPVAKPNYASVVTRSSNNEAFDMEALKSIQHTRFAPLPNWYTDKCANLEIDFGAVRALQIVEAADRDCGHCQMCCGNDGTIAMIKAVALQIAITQAGGCAFSKYRTSSDLFLLISKQTSFSNCESKDISGSVAKRGFGGEYNLCQAIRAFYANEFAEATRHIKEGIPAVDPVEQSPAAGCGAGVAGGGGIGAGGTGFGGPTIATRLPTSAMRGIGNIGPYRKDLIMRLSKHWCPRFPNQNIIVSITIGKDGTLLDSEIFQSSGQKKNDKAALKAVQHTEFATLPDWFKGDHLTFKLDLSKVEAVSQ